MTIQSSRDKAVVILDMIITALVRIEVYDVATRQEVLKLIEAHSQDTSEVRINNVLEAVKKLTLDTASEYGEVL